MLQIPFYYIHKRLKVLGEIGFKIPTSREFIDETHQQGRINKYGGYTRNVSDIPLEECFHFMETSPNCFTEAEFRFMVMQARKEKAKETAEKKREAFNLSDDDEEEEKDVDDEEATEKETSRSSKRKRQRRPFPTRARSPNRHGFGGATPHDPTHLRSLF